MHGPWITRHFKDFSIKDCDENKQRNNLECREKGTRKT